MTQLSPQAQAVLDAHQSTSVRPVAKAQIAAALRAAAEQIENLYCDDDVEDSPGIVFAMRQLMLIANELEGSTVDEYGYPLKLGDFYAS
jgi:hypothetical protein